VKNLNKIIAVEENLGPVKEFLSTQGCQVISIEKAMEQQPHAVVLSGMKQNLMGMQEIIIDAPIISAQGKSAEEIWSEIMKKA